MKKNPLLLLAGLGAAGLLSGYSANRITADPVTATGEAGLPSGQRAHGASSLAPAVPVRPARQAGRIDAAGIRSSDTLETLKEVPPEELYRRLALWMLDASEPEIAAWWQHYRSLPNRANEINDLIFINWTRVDPRAATAAAAGTPDEHYAWWAWACHDPEGSLATVLAENPGRLNNVTWGLGEFHPDWLMANFDRIPEEGRRNALSGLSKWDDVANPLEVMTFLQKHGVGFQQRLFKVLVKKDPWAAYDYIQENGALPGAMNGTDSMSEFVNAVAAEHPDMLDQLAGQMPSGQLKRTIESVVFKELLKTDPAAAIEHALNTEAPKIAEDRLSAAGLSLLREDPDQAFEMAERLLSISPGALEGMTRIVHESGSSGWGSGAPEANRLISALLAKEPERVIGIALPDGAPAPSFHNITELWANQDLEGFASWVNGQDDAAIREPAANVIINRLLREQQFAEAAEWSATVESPHQLPNLLRNWANQSPAEAATWLENSGLPAERIEELRTHTQARQ